MSTLCKTLATTTSNPCRELLIDPEIGPNLIRSVAKRLRSQYDTELEESETMGWAQVGLARAANEFDPSRFAGETRNITRRLCKYLLVKGRNCAIDEMRSMHIVGRNRYGKYHASHIKMEEWSTLPDDAFGYFMVDPPDHRTSSDDPTCDAVCIRDAYALIQSRLTGQDRRVFDLAYVDGKSMSDISGILEVSSARVYQLHSELLRKVYVILGGRSSPFCPN
jgi:DNA-directed RNA polymerase specialized sigma24 family protein